MFHSSVCRWLGDRLDLVHRMLLASFLVAACVSYVAHDHTLGWHVVCWNGGVCGPVFELAVSRLWPTPNGSTTLAASARPADDPGAVWQFFAILCTPLLGAGAWLAFMHGGFAKEARCLSSMSLTKQRERTTHMATKAFFLFGAVSVLNAPRASVSDADRALTTVAFYGVGPILMPMSLRTTFVTHNALICAGLFTIRGGVAYALHSDAFYYDKVMSCGAAAPFIAFRLFFAVTMFALVGTPTLPVAAFCSVAAAIVAFGACGNDVFEASAFLVFIGVLVALQHWSRRSARLYTIHHNKQDREQRVIAQGVTNWAAPNIPASNSDGEDEEEEEEEDEEEEGEEEGTGNTLQM